MNKLWRYYLNSDSWICMNCGYQRAQRSGGEDQPCESCGAHEHIPTTSCALREHPGPRLRGRNEALERAIRMRSIRNGW